MAYIMFNLIKIRSPHLLPIFHRLFCSRRVQLYCISLFQ